MNDPTPVRRTHPAALASFLLGLLSAALGLLVLNGLPELGLGLTARTTVRAVILLVFAVLPALFFGLRGLRAVNTSNGALRGARLAIAGMILGTLGTTITVLGLGSVVAVRLRQNSNRVECINNLRQIGLALNKYADVHKRFPAATSDPRRLTPVHRLSWLADVVPLLAEGTPRAARYQELAKKIDRTKAWDDPANATAVATPVRIFLCPGHPDFEPNRSPGLTHYVGVAGIDPGAADLRRDDPRAGMFGNDRGVRRRDAERGISFTMMVLETTADNGPWLAGGHPTVRGLAPDEEHYIGPGRQFGGMHRGIVNVLWVDGGVRALGENMPGDVFRAQATLRGPAEEEKR
jgi:hypothetical protein